MSDPKTIASLITDNPILSGEQLLEMYLSANDSIYFESFRLFCSKYCIIVEYNEFMDLLKENRTYLFNEYFDRTTPYWVPSLAEGYVINSLPKGEWGDDQIEGITTPVLGGPQQPLDFEPLSDEQILDDPESTPQLADIDIDPEEDDLPGFDTRIKHRPSRDPKAEHGVMSTFESAEPGLELSSRLDNQAGNNGPALARLYGLVDSWQNGAMDQPTFETEVHKLSEEPTLKNSSISVEAMIQKILNIRRAT